MPLIMPVIVSSKTVSRGSKEDISKHVKSVCERRCNGAHAHMYL